MKGLRCNNGRFWDDQIYFHLDHCWINGDQISENIFFPFLLNRTHMDLMPLLSKFPVYPRAQRQIAISRLSSCTLCSSVFLLTLKQMSYELRYLAMKD